MQKAPFILLIILFLLNGASAQHTRDQISIDEQGIMRWTKDNTEVKGFGINYTVPFAYAYRNGKKMGVDLKAAIDQDIYQFARLGFDLFRVHVWDTEISDTLGNLLQNEHLELFDYLLAQLKKHKINAIITPIAYWGNGWPERDEVTPGFSHKYGKGECLVNPDAIRAQENYLRQFVNHVNPYTGKAYKDEPSILAFEVSNEPHHDGTPAEVTAFIKKMVFAIHQTGCTKPVFYNVSHKVHLADAYFAAGIDGGTFQWYPTGLGFQKELLGNMLPNVDRYPIPFDTVMKKYHAARIVYEFDAADMATNYLYPAMARSFRTSGIQLATHFAWDPTFTAPYNTEYNTHFMNLLYAPQKALSLMISGEIFRSIPLYSDYGVYPDNKSFGPFRISNEDNLAEMVTDEKFIYTNNTSSKPTHPEKLELIAGWGNSPLIEYEGTGAYFLDKMGDDIWRLEIMPDAVQVNNLFGRNNLQQVVAVIKQERRKMKFNLPGFENGFSIESVDWHDSIIYRETQEKTIALKPGIYLLMGWKYINDDSLLLQAKKPVVMENELVYPASPDSIIFYHSATLWNEHQDQKITLTLVCPERPKKVTLDYCTLEKGLESQFEMKEVNPFIYEVNIPARYFIRNTFMYAYNFNVELKSGYKTYLRKDANAFSHDDPNPFNVTGYPVYIAESSRPTYLFTPGDIDRSNKEWLPSFQFGSSFAPTEDPLVRINVYISLPSLVKKDNENLLAEPIADYTIRHYFADRLKGKEKEVLNKKTLFLGAHTIEGHTYPVQIALVQKDGTAYGGILQVNNHDKKYSISLDQLKPVPVVLMPRPYPTFLPYFSTVKPGSHLDLSQIESLQISIGPGIPKENLDKPIEVILESVWLE